MRVSIRDAGTLQAIRPLELAAYLRAAGWREAKSIPNEYATWVLADKSGDEFEATLPLNHAFGDYSLRIGSIMAVLEVVEQRSQLEILSDLLTTSADVVRLRIGNGEPSDGSIPIEEGVKIVQKTRDMMMAAACSVVDHRAVFQTRKPNQAVDYMRRLRMGQTERGSYVVTVISRVAPILTHHETNQLFEVNEPYERQVTSTLAHALAATRSAAEKGAVSGGVDAFQEAVPKGVSANLCDAIVGISMGGESSRNIEVDFSWSRTRPAFDQLPRKVVLTADAMPVIEEAGRYLRETSPREEFELRGPVIRLDRIEGADVGTITVHGFVDDQPRKVSLDLSETEYHLAVQAHEARQTVACYGVLVREGRSFRLKNPRELVIESEE
jgi:hypothetical protein